MRVEIESLTMQKNYRKQLIVIVSFIIFLLLPTAVNAVPIFFSVQPQNNTYTSGGLRLVSTNISAQSLDTSSVKLHIKAEEEVIWDEYAMSCSAYGSNNWYCSYTLSLAIAGSDTKEVFYIDGNDTNGYNSSGIFNFILDREAPDIEFSVPTNNTYVLGNVTVTLEVSDASSGVNSSTVKYSFDNSTWLSMTKSGSQYTANWDTGSVANNQSVRIYAIAKDIIGNEAVTDINVSVDNKAPSVDIVQPTGGVLIGTVKLEITSVDEHSGISSATYSITSVGGSLECSNNATKLCEGYLDTNAVSDGVHDLVFRVEDSAGNYNSTSVSVNISNIFPSVTITKPTAYARGITVVNASLSRAANVRLKIDNSWFDMSCSGTSCTYEWNTTGYSDGSHTLLANVSGIDGTSTNSKTVTVDNKKPALVINSPSNTTVSGVIYPQVTVTDEIGVDDDTIVFRITTSNYNSGAITTACTQHLSGKKYFCTGNFNTTILVDGSYTLRATAADLAGNSNSTSITITTVNGVTATTTTTTISTTTTIPGVTTTTSPTGTTTTTSPGPTILPGISSESFPLVLAGIVVTIAAIAIVIIYKMLKGGKKEPWQVDFEWEE
jgi:hypothetical protein